MLYANVNSMDKGGDTGQNSLLERKNALDSHVLACYIAYRILGMRNQYRAKPLEYLVLNLDRLHTPVSIHNTKSHCIHPGHGFL